MRDFESATQKTATYFIVKPQNNQNYLMKQVHELDEFEGRIVHTSCDYAESETLCKVLNKERQHWED